MEGLTAQQMEYEAKLVYESLASADAPGYNSRMWSVLLTQAQEKIVLEVIKQGLDNDELNRRKISPLLKQGVLAEISGDSHIPFGYRVKFPSKFLHIVKDSAVVERYTVDKSSPCVRRLTIIVRPDEVAGNDFGNITFTKEDHSSIVFNIDALWTEAFTTTTIKNFNKSKPYGTVAIEEEFAFKANKDNSDVVRRFITLVFYDKYGEFEMELNPATGVQMVQTKLKDFVAFNTLVRVKPISYDYYHTNVENPYEQPYQKLFWRLIDSEGAVVITDGRPLQSYIVTYVERPSPIVTTQLDESQAIENVKDVTDCQLDPIVHRDIVYAAARLATAYTGDSNNYQLQSIEGQR
jgi:hypothetical protein